MRIHYQGLIKSSASWAHVGRNLVMALDCAGCDVSVTSCKGFLYEPGFSLPDRLRVLLDTPRREDIALAIEYPGNYHHLAGKKKAAILFYESSELPPRWKKPVMEHLDHLIVPSRYCRSIMTDAGIPGEMVSVVPYGVDLEVFNPGIPPVKPDDQDRFVFLHIAAPHIRKGTRELIRAYMQAFAEDDPVVLVLKSSYKPSGRPWESSSFKQVVREETAGRKNLPEIKIIVRQEPEEKIAGYLRGCDCYVQPSYSEGFGLIIPQAMACGAPVITCLHTAMTDYCDETNVLPVSSREVPAGPMQYDYPDGNGIVYQPDADDLSLQLRRMHKDESLRRMLVKNGLETARRLTWEKTAKEMMRVLSGL